MKKLMLGTLFSAALALALAACSESASQSPTAVDDPSLSATSGTTAERIPWRHLIGRLDLTDEQREAMKAVREAHRDEFEALRTKREDGATREDLKAEHQDLMAAVHAEMLEILTDEQRTRLEELKAEFLADGGRRFGFKRGAGEGPRGPRLERMAEELDLTDDQKEQIRELFAARRAERPKFRGNPPSAEEREAHREAMHQELERILTAEQFQKFLELRPEGPGYGGRHHRGQG